DPLAAATPALATTAWRLRLARLLHTARLDRRLDRRRTLEPLQASDLGALLGSHLLQRRDLAQQSQHQRLQRGDRQTIKIGGGRHAATGPEIGRQRNRLTIPRFNLSHSILCPRPLNRTRSCCPAFCPS